MKRNIAVLVVACSACMAFADPNDPQVTCVSCKQDYERVLRVEYTLDEPAIVTFDVKTNGVSIGAENLKLAYGDVHKVVEAGARTLNWPAREAWPDHRFGKDVVSVTVTAWATNSPPDYMVIKLVGEDKGARTFYTAPEQLPGVGGVTNDMYKTDYLVMRRIPAAGKTFRMGPPPEVTRTVKEIRHNVALTNDFYMAVFELTQAQYSNVLNKACSLSVFESYAAKYSADLLGYEEVGTAPVPQTRFSDFRGTAKSWPADGHEIAANSELYIFRTSLNLPTLDLPTEAEWEFACRAGTTGNRYDGTADGTNPTCGQVPGGTWPPRKPKPVGLLQPNAFGLYDMICNVAEICLDLYVEDDSYVTDAPGVTIAPKGPVTDMDGAQSRRVVRGLGYWDADSATKANAWFRGEKPQNDNYPAFGYRLVCTF